jgi:hypothetical protein
VLRSQVSRELPLFHASSTSRTVRRCGRGIKDSPPYFHDGRLPTLEDTVEFFNFAGGLKLDQEEKKALTDFLRAL